MSKEELIKTGEFRFYNKIRNILDKWDDPQDAYMVNKMIQTIDCLIESEMVSHEN